MKAAVLNPEATEACVFRGVRRGLVVPDTPVAWRLAALSGRFGEISGDRASAVLTLVFRLVLEAQRMGEPVAWITSRQSLFYPPDASEAGVDLGALAVVRVSETGKATRATDHLVRSAAFGLLILDLGKNAYLPIQAQTRLVGLAKKHDTALLCVTEKESRQPSIGSLVSIRVDAARTQREQDRFRCEVRVLKDKRRGPGWTHGEVCRGPDGLC